MAMVTTCTGEGLDRMEGSTPLPLAAAVKSSVQVLGEILQVVRTYRFFTDASGLNPTSLRLVWLWGGLERTRTRRLVFLSLHEFRFQTARQNL
jgi:hypothetical protein